MFCENQVSFALDVRGDGVQTPFGMNLHIKTSLGIKNYFWDPNAVVENETFLTDFLRQIRVKNTKINLSSESVKIKEHK